VLVAGADGTIAFATDSVQPLLGHPAPELKGRRVEELVDPEHRTRLADLLRAARGMPDATAGELTWRHRDGHAVHTDLRVSDRLEDPDVTGVVLTLRDVTERRRLESRCGAAASRTG
jgi:PAS domain S-box-containing protein